MGTIGCLCTTFATHSLKKSLAELDVPEVRDFLDLLKNSGAKIWACQLSADMNHLGKEDLYEGLKRSSTQATSSR
jgi:predicted peroxiredoxin